MSVRSMALAAASMLAFAATPAMADVLINVTQSSSGVRFDVSGNLNISTFIYIGSSNFVIKYITPQNGEFAAYGIPYDTYLIPNGSIQSFGSGATTNAGSVGGAFALLFNGSYPNQVKLPQGYVSGGALSAFLLFNNSTFSSLGITPTDFSYAITGGNKISYVFSTITAVPEPATWGMMITGFGLVGAAMRRRSTKVTFA